MGTLLPLRKKGEEPPPPIFGPCLLWPNGWVDQDRTWHEGKVLSPGDLVVLDGDPAPLPIKGAEPPSQFSAHFYGGQTAGCTKMPLGMELGLSPGEFVLDGDIAPPQKGGGLSQIFGPCFLCPNRWMNHDATWYAGRPQPRGLCIRWEPSLLPKKGAERPPQFSAHV